MLNLKTIHIPNFVTKSGKARPIKLSYQTFGQELGSAPIVLVNHALTGNSNVCGEDGWWKDLIGDNYNLRFPFQIKPELFGEALNLEDKVEIGQDEIAFNNTPNEQFFFSNLSGNEEVDAHWELINTKSKIGISEKGNFKTSKVNLWGWKHVVSPELFFEITVEPGRSIEWSRTYNVFEIN